MYLSDFAAGLAHPFGGADHVFAMAAVGLWSVVAGGRALWAWPAAFVAMVLLGFTAGIFGVRVPFVEPAIAGSIVLLGLLIALAVRAPLWAGVVIGGLFAFFHGHAHGTEAAAAGVQPITYAWGFSVATAALHGAGLATGVFFARSSGKSLLRMTGGLIALGGVALIVAPA